MLNRWTISRAEGVGTVCGAAALVLWPLFATLQQPLRLPFELALGATAFCGLSVFWITTLDRFRRGKRGEELRPVRAFDLALALVLTVPPLWFLKELLG